MRILRFILLCLFFLEMFSNSSFAKSNCPWFFDSLLPVLGFKSKNKLIHAPEKTSLKIQDGKIPASKVDLVEKGPEQVVVSNQPMNQVKPGNESELSRISKKLDDQGTALVTYRNRFGPKGAFVDLRVKGSPRSQNGVIVLNSSASKNPDLRAVLGHEAYHAKMQSKRARGERDLFNSEFFSKSNTGGTYDQYISSEEIHAWSKEFNQSAVKAQHRETLKLILSKEEPLKQVRIKSSTVVADGYQKLKKEYELLIDTHDRFINDVAVRLDAGDFKLKFDEQNRVIIETEAYDFKPGNHMKLPNGSADLLAIRKEIGQLMKVNRTIRLQLNSVDELIRSGTQKRYFTGEEYIRLKNELSRLGGAVTQK